VGVRVRWVFFLMVCVGMEEAAACRTDVSKVVTACSSSLIVRVEGWEAMEWSRVVRKSGQFACL
jgi:hypothetical protein